VIGAPDIDEVVKRPRSKLVLVVGDVGGEISVAAVGFSFKGRIDIVAIGGGRETTFCLTILIVL